MPGSDPHLTYSVLALAALTPATAVALYAGAGEPAARTTLFWGPLLLALAGSLAWAVAQMAVAWHTGFSFTLWVTVAGCLLLFTGLAALSPATARLGPLLLPYLLLLGLLATIWERAGARETLPAPPGPWLRIHIGVSVATYACVTLAGIAGLAVLLQERALKAKRPTALTRMLPSVADAEALQIRLLAASAVVLAIGLATGVAVAWFLRGAPMPVEHKTLLTVLSFVVICGLLWAHLRTGVRGRLAARLVLLAWLLLTLGYPGVKFVTDVLMAA